jgi:hypothetical protein
MPVALNTANALFRFDSKSMYLQSLAVFKHSARILAKKWLYCRYRDFTTEVHGTHAFNQAAASF